MKPNYDLVYISDYKEPKTGMELMYLKTWGRWEKLFSSEFITHYEILQELDEDEFLGRSFDSLIEWMKELKEDNLEFDSLSIESCSVRSSRGEEWTKKFYLVGSNLETESQRKERLQDLEDKQKLFDEKNLKKIQEKDKEEFEKYLDLKKKFGDTP